MFLAVLTMANAQTTLGADSACPSGSDSCDAGLSLIQKKARKLENPRKEAEHKTQKVDDKHNIGAFEAMMSTDASLIETEKGRRTGRAEFFQMSANRRNGWTRSLGLKSKAAAIRHRLNGIAEKWHYSFAAGIIFVLSAVSSAAVGFGGAVIFTALWRLGGIFDFTDGDALSGAAILLVLNHVTVVGMALLLRNYTSWPCVAWALPSICVGYGLGTCLLIVAFNASEASQAYYALAVGGMLLFVASFQIFLLSRQRAQPSERQKSGATEPHESSPLVHPEVPVEQKKADSGMTWESRSVSFTVAFVLCRLFQGFFSGLTGLGGWPAMTFALVFQPEKNEFRATQGVMLTGLALVFVPLFFWFGILDPMAQWPLLVSCIMGQILGSIIGTGISLDQDTWLLWLVGVVVGAAIIFVVGAVVSLSALQALPATSTARAALAAAPL